MTLIYSFLQKRKMHDNQHGIITVVIAYVLSAAMLVLGSDAFYNINSAAAGISMDTEEGTEVVRTEDISPLKSTDASSSLLQTTLINPYHLEDNIGLNGLVALEASGETGNSASLEAAADTFGYEDTISLLGTSSAEEGSHQLMEKLQGYVAEKKANDTAQAKKEKAKKAAEKEKKEKEIESLTVKVASSSKAIKVTKAEVAMLERIVEAEAGGEDTVGKILVANVIFNRIVNKEFPNSVEGVIFQKSQGKYQFSPVKNGRYWSVKVSDETEKAVERALSGEDYSEGALYFVARKKTTSSNIKWFDNNLDRLFKHGGHEFYR